MDVYDEIKAERERQDARWGGEAHDDSHDRIRWVEITYSYLRQANDEAHGKSTGPEGYRGRMLQVIALGVAAIEADDREQRDKEIVDRHFGSRTTPDAPTQSPRAGAPSDDE